MSYELQARRANGTVFSDAYYDDEDQRAEDDLDNELLDRLRELQRGDGIFLSILEALEELTDDRGDRDEWRDLFPFLKHDYQAASSRLRSLDDGIIREFKDIAPRDEEIVARRER